VNELKISSDIYIYPADTVWGIGGNIFDPSVQPAIAKIKNTDDTKPLSILYSDLEELKIHFNFHFIKDWESFEKVMGMGVSLLVKNDYATSIFPQYFKNKYPFISFRLLTEQIYRDLRTEIGAPFFSTSLNLTGEAPILDESSALKFKEQFAPNARFVPQSKVQLKGQSSCIIKIEEDRWGKIQFQIIRDTPQSPKIIQSLQQLIESGEES